MTIPHLLLSSLCGRWASDPHNVKSKNMYSLFASTDLKMLC